MKFDVEFLTQILNEPFITVALLASKMEITMSGLDAVAKIAQDAQEYHTISPAAQRHNVKTVMGQKLMFCDEIGYFILHFSLYVKHKSLEVLALGVVDVNRMVTRLMQLMEDTHLTSSLGSCREDCITEMILRDHL